MPLVALHETVVVKVFGCRPLACLDTRTGGRRPKTSKGGNRGSEGGAVPRAAGLRGFESCAQSRRQAMFNGRRARTRTQLERYGTDIAKWGFELSRLM